MDQKPWNGTCPCCGDERAYQGFFDWECPNPACKKHSKAQEDIIEALEPELPDRPKIAPDFPEDYTPDQKDIETIPFFPTDPYGACIGGAPTDPDDDDDGDGATVSITTQAGTVDDDDDDGPINPVSLDWDGFDGYGSGFFK